jgi:hypothetical protein
MDRLVDPVEPLGNQAQAEHDQHQTGKPDRNRRDEECARTPFFKVGKELKEMVDASRGPLSADDEDDRE